MTSSLFGVGGTVLASQGGTIVPQSFIGTVGQTVFNLTNFTYTPATNSIQVYINGSLQQARDYTETSSTSFTLNQGVVAGDFIDVIGVPAFTPTAVTAGVVNVVGAGGGVLSVQAILSSTYVTPLTFGAVPDYQSIPGQGTDNYAALQAWLNYISNQTITAVGNGGGIGWLPAGNYRCTQGLRFGRNCDIQGVGGGGYPYFDVGAKLSIITFDFGANVNQWALQSNTFHSVAGGSGPIVYNEWVSGNIDGIAADGFSSTHGVKIRNLAIMDANGNLQTNVPYGALRLVGCPNSELEDITIYGFGYGLTYNCSFGSVFKRVTAQTNYYGLMCYNANNGITGQGQFDQIITPAKLVLLAGSNYIPNWMPNAAAFAGASFNMDARHTIATKGCTVAALQAVGSNGASLNIICQNWDDHTFLYNSYATTFTQTQGEQIAHDFIVSAYASARILNGHLYSTLAPLPYTGDFGYQSEIEINMGGNNTNLGFARNVWGSGLAGDSTQITVLNYSGSGGNLPSTPRLNKVNEEGTFVPTVVAIVGGITTVGAVSAQYTKQGRLVTVTFDISITTNGTGSAGIYIGNFPYACRGIFTCGVGKEIGITGKAITVSVVPGENRVNAQYYDGTYPGANGARLVGSITYPT